VPPPAAAAAAPVAGSGAQGAQAPAPPGPGAAAGGCDADAEAAALEAEAAELEAEAERFEAAQRAARVQAAWTAHKSPDGRLFYYNTETRESSWVRPAGFKGDAAAVGGLPVPVAQAPVGDTGWLEVKCQDGRRSALGRGTTGGAPPWHGPHLRG
jgi:hypothetical protein